MTEAVELGQISFFLGKPDKNFSALLDPDVNLDAKGARIVDFESDGLACRFIYFVTTSNRTNPPWLDFINDKIDPPEEKFSFEHIGRRPNGLLLLEIENRVLAASFGLSATSLLFKKHLEPDFGIKTAMNMCGNESIRQTRSQNTALTTTHIDRQVSRPSDPFAFGLSDAEDLRYISAHIKNEGNITLQGKDSLTIKILGTEKLDWHRLTIRCREFLLKYDSKDYVDLFPNYKNFSPASDAEIKKLNAILIDTLKVRDFSKAHLSIPEFLQDDDFGFSFTNTKSSRKQNTYYAYLDIGKLDNHIDFSKLSAELLDSRYIYAHSYSQDKILDYRKWSIFDCIVFETDLEGKYFVLSDGQWFQIDDDFYIDILDFIENTLVAQTCEPEFADIDISSKDDMKNYEGIFNEEVCRRRKLAIKFDKAKLKIGTGRKDKEFCDILELVNDEFIRIIHCKPFKDAQSINYLFSQAKFYCESFTRDPTFLTEIREYIAASGSPIIDKYLDYIGDDIKKVNGDRYTVCLWLLCDNRHALPTKYDIPIMAQYELKLAHDYLTRVCKFSEVIVRFVPVKKVAFSKSKSPVKIS